MPYSVVKQIERDDVLKSDNTATKIQKCNANFHAVDIPFSGVMEIKLDFMAPKTNG
jgi:hypothetical protein